jgi:hypothetical protein
VNVIAEVSLIGHAESMEERERARHHERTALGAPTQSGPADPAQDATHGLDWRRVMALAWRPAWSIRSRRGACAVFRTLFGGRQQD